MGGELASRQHRLRSDPVGLPGGPDRRQHRGDRRASTRYRRSGSSPGRRNGGGVWLSGDARTAKLISASDRSLAYTPCATYGSSTSKRTVSPAWSSGRNCLCSAITSREARGLAVVERRARSIRPRDGRTSRCAARKASVCVRPVVCDVGGPMWAPISSGGDQHRGATLDRLALECVVAVARPDPNGAPQDLVIDPRAARRAALDLDVGMGRAELVEQPVQRERLGVRAGRTIGTRRLDVIAVHVPLDERDVVIARAVRRDARRRARTRRGWRDRARAGCGRAPARSPRSSAPTPGGRGTGRCRGSPSPARPRCRTPSRATARGRSAAPARRDTSPARPTSRRGPSVSSRRDPNQPSSSTKRSIPTLGRGRRECAEALGVVVEVHRLPRVEQHRTGRRRMRRTARGGGGGIPMWPVSGHRRNGPRRRRGSSYDSPGSRATSPGWSSSPSWTMRRPSGSRSANSIVVATPRQVDAPDLALPLAEPDGAREQQRWMLVRRATAPVLGERGAARPRPAMRLELTCVPPVERQQVAGVLGQRERDAQPVEHVAGRRLRS